MATESVPPIEAAPALHFTPTSGWINDPHGVTYYNGEYHAFFQYVPEIPEWRPSIAWGHATSPDLLTWTEQPVALTAGDGDDGCFTGAVAVPERGPAAMLYTSVSHDGIDLGRIRLARPVDDSWTAWRKEEFLASAPPDEALAVYRDPYVFRDGDRWRMFVGAGYADGSPGVMCYSSDDPSRWTFDGPLEVRTPDGVERPWSGAAWECPQLVTVGGRHVLILSVWSGANANAGHPVVAAVGELDGVVFHVARWQRLTEGPGHFASSAFVFADGTPGLISWFRGVGDDAAGWRGAFSLPYRISVQGDVAVTAPDEALAQRRTDPGAGFHHSVDVEWAPSVADEGTSSFAAQPVDADASVQLAVVRADGVTVATLDAGPGRLTMRVGSAQPVIVPRGHAPVRLVLDGTMLEGTTGETIFGSALPPGDTRYRIEGAATAGNVRSWALRAGAI